MAVFLLELLHLGRAPDQVARIEYLSESPYVRVPRRCPDCTGRPEPILPADGFDAALLLIHDGSCPTLGAMTRRRGDPG